MRIFLSLTYFKTRLILHSKRWTGFLTSAGKHDCPDFRHRCPAMRGRRGSYETPGPSHVVGQWRICWLLSGRTSETKTLWCEYDIGTKRKQNRNCGWRIVGRWLKFLIWKCAFPNEVTKKKNNCIFRHTLTADGWNLYQAIQFQSKMWYHGFNEMHADLYLVFMNCSIPSIVSKVNRKKWEKVTENCSPKFCILLICFLRFSPERLLDYCLH